MEPLERFALWFAVVTGVIGAIANVIQVVLQWFILRETGDMDHDEADWWEKLPWRRYYRGER